jgi:hypothetical protein
MQGSITILVGTSTAGKTSIFDHITKKDITRKWSIEGSDATATKILFNIMQEDQAMKKLEGKNLLGKQSLYWTIHDAQLIVGSEVLDLSKQISEDDLRRFLSRHREYSAEDVADMQLLITRYNNDLVERVEEFNNNLERIVAKESIQSHKQGYSVIIDIIPDEPNIVEEIIKELKRNDYQGNINTILVHCPLKQVASRIEARNQRAEAGNEPLDKRSVIMSLQHYCNLFEFQPCQEWDKYYSLSQNEMGGIMNYLVREGSVNNSDNIDSDDNYEDDSKLLKLMCGFTNEEVRRTKARSKMSYDLIVHNDSSYAFEQVVSDIIKYVNHIERGFLRPEVAGGGGAVARQSYKLKG